MKGLLYFFFVLLIVVNAMGRRSRQEDFVVELSSTNFDEMVFSGNWSWFINFYQADDKNSRSFDYRFSRLAEDKQDSSLRFGRVDCISNQVLGSRFSVYKYPTQKLFRDGSVYTYKGSKNVRRMVRWLDGGYRMAVVWYMWWIFVGFVSLIPVMLFCNCKFYGSTECWFEQGKHVKGFKLV